MLIYRQTYSTYMVVVLSPLFEGAFLNINQRRYTRGVIRQTRN